VDDLGRDAVMVSPRIHALVSFFIPNLQHTVSLYTFVFRINAAWLGGKVVLHRSEKKLLGVRRSLYLPLAQDAVIRVPQSVRKRIGKFGFKADADWQMKLHWQLAYQHPDSLAWTWSKSEVRFLYEFAESMVINTNRTQWNMNIANDGFHLGRSRNLMLEGLFAGIYDLETYEDRFEWINKQSWHPKYKATLVDKLSKAGVIIRLFQGGFGEDVVKVQAQLFTPAFEHLSAEKRKEYYDKLSIQGLFGGAWGRTWRSCRSFFSLLDLTLSQRSSARSTTTNCRTKVFSAVRGGRTWRSCRSSF